MFVWPQSWRLHPLSCSHGVRLATQNWRGILVVDWTYYCCVVAKLLHVTHTRPNILFATSMCIQFMTKPQVPHLNIALTIFEYLKHTIDFCLLYHGGESVVPHGYFNSEYQGDLDERKSTSSYVISLGIAPISWKSKLQDEIVQCSAKAKHNAMNEAAIEADWNRNILGEIGFPCKKSLTFFYENQSSIKMAKNLVRHARTRHLEGNCHYIRDQVKTNRAHLTFVRSKEQNANILTKPLTRANFEKTEQDLAFTRRLSLENNSGCIRGLMFEAGIKERFWVLLAIRSCVLKSILLSGSSCMASCSVCSVPSSPITGNCYGLEMERPTQCWNKEPPQTLMDWKRFSELPTISCTERKITESMCSAACTKQIAYRNPALKKWISQSNSKRAKASSSGDKQNRPQFESVAHNRLIYEFCTWEQKHDQSQCMKWGTQISNQEQ